MESELVLEVQNVRKEYDGHVAVKDVSLKVPGQCVFGLLGPNGAGKTTLIRMITGITMADQGLIRLNGQPVQGILNRNIGYLPEERGLYKKMRVAEQLIYLARLKGLSKDEAMKRTRHWLEKFGMMDWRKRQIDELSKGMQQKVQFISTILHDPDLIILDEPFTGLDPVNTNLIKEEIENLRDQGKSIIFSTHRMEQVEEVCEKIALINNGENVLDGDVWEIKEKFKDNTYQLILESDFPASLTAKYSPELLRADLKRHKNLYRLSMDQGKTSSELLTDVIQAGGRVLAFEEILPSLNDVFIKIVSDYEE